MLDPAVVEFLSRHNQAFLLTHRADGWPTGYPMVGSYHDGGIEFSTYRASAKVTRVLRREQASCLVVPRDDGNEPSLWVRGPAAIKAGPSPRTSAAPMAAERLDVPAEVAATVASRQRDGRRCIVRVEIEATRWIGGTVSAA